MERPLEPRQPHDPRRVAHDRVAVQLPDLGQQPEAPADVGAEGVERQPAHARDLTVEVDVAGAHGPLDLPVQRLDVGARRRPVEHEGDDVGREVGEETEHGVGRGLAARVASGRG